MNAINFRRRYAMILLGVMPRIEAVERIALKRRRRPPYRRFTSAAVRRLQLCYPRATWQSMKQLNLREANQEFSRLVREIEATGERVLVLRNGKPAVEIVPSGEERALRRKTPAQERAVAAFLRSARTRPANSSGRRRWTRDELHER